MQTNYSAACLVIEHLLKDDERRQLLSILERSKLHFYQRPSMFHHTHLRQFFLTPLLYHISILKNIERRISRKSH